MGSGYKTSPSFLPPPAPPLLAGGAAGRIERPTRPEVIRLYVYA